MKLKLVGRLASGDPLSIPSAGRTRNEATRVVTTRTIEGRNFQYPLRVVPGMKLLLKFTDGDILPVLSIPSAGRTRNEAMVLSVILPLPSAFNTLCGSYQE